MGSTPEKVDRIIARDTQTTWPDPWSYYTTHPDGLLRGNRTWDQ